MSNTDLATIAPEQQGLAVRVSPLEALALMSDAEFAERLAAVKKAQRRMAIIQREIMDDKIDYGLIPGTGNKPTLLKPGAEKLCKFYHLVPTFHQTVFLGDGERTPHIRILSVCSLHHESEAGPIVAQGMGAASSWEKKYRYRDGQRRCPSCGAAAIIKGKEEYGGGWLCYTKRGGCGAKYVITDTAITDQPLGQVENPDPFDMENTITKMSAKRAQVDATLRATATSGLFTQDVEDMTEAEKASIRPEDMPQDRPAQAGQPARKPTPPAPRPEPAQQPTRPAQPNGNRPITDPQKAAIKAMARKEHPGITDEEIDAGIKEGYGVPLAELTSQQASAVISSFQKPAPAAE